MSHWKQRHTKCGIPAPFPGVGNRRAGVAPRTLLTAEEHAGSQDTEPLSAHHTSFPSDPGSVLQRSDRGHRGGMGTRLNHPSLHLEESWDDCMRG